MSYNMKGVYPNWNFELHGTSTIENPIDNTLIKVEKNDKKLLNNLTDHKYCVIVTDKGVLPENKNIMEYNFFLYSDNINSEYKRIKSKIEEI